MPFDGSGTFNPAITFVPNTLATAEDQNTLANDFAEGLTDCLTRDGQAPATNNLSLGGNQLKDVKNPTVDTDAATMGWTKTYVSSLVKSVRAAQSGGFDTASLSDYLVYWNYLYASTKSQVIPSANTANAGFVLIIKDRYGDAQTNNIQVTPQSGTIDLSSNYTINTNKGFVYLVADPNSNDWIVS